MTINDLLRVPAPLRRVRQYQRKYGPLKGTRLALQLRRALRAPPGSLVSVDIPGLPAPVQLRARTSDVQVVHQVFADEHLCCRLRDQPRFIIDAGAYIGLSSLYLSSLFPASCIVALEFESSNYSLLKANTATCPGIIPLQKALWSRRAHVRVANPSAEKWEFKAAEVLPGMRDAVEAVGVSDLLEEFKYDMIDLLKIDIEGAEKEVFSSGAESWIDRVKAIAIELHEGLNPGCTQALYDATRGRDFVQWKQGEYVFLVRRALVYKEELK